MTYQLPTDDTRSLVRALAESSPLSAQLFHNNAWYRVGVETLAAMLPHTLRGMQIEAEAMDRTRRRHYEVLVNASSTPNDVRDALTGILDGRG